MSVGEGFAHCNEYSFMARETKEQRKESKLQRDRLRILLDVVSQLDEHKLIAEQGIYVKFNEKVPNSTINKRGDMQSNLKNLVSKARPCRVCALGACFISAVSLFDKVQTQDILAEELVLGSRKRNEIRHDVEETNMREKLLPYFTLLELGTIEALFENKANFIGGETVDYPDDLDVEEERQAYDDAEILQQLLNAIYSTADRLRWIMNAAANLVHTGRAINVRGFRNQALVSLGSDERFGHVRDEHGL